MPSHSARQFRFNSRSTEACHQKERKRDDDHDQHSEDNSHDFQNAFHGVHLMKELPDLRSQPSGELVSLKFITARPRLTRAKAAYRFPPAFPARPGARCPCGSKSPFLFCLPLFAPCATKPARANNECY